MNRPLQHRCALLLLAVLPMGAGCGSQQATSDETIKEQAQQIEQLEATLEETRATHAHAMEALREELAGAHQRELDDLGSTLRRQVNEHSRTIAGLREELEALRQPTAASSTPRQPAPQPVAAPPAPPIPATPAISVYRPPQADVSNFIDPPTGPDADLFPVRIDSVKGEQIVIGSHMSSRLVDSGEVVKDKFGEDKPVMVPELFEIEDYDHQVSFTAENLTRTPLTVTFRAGRDRQSLTIDSGATLTGRVPSVVGASLSVRANGESRSFPVSYP